LRADHYSGPRDILEHGRSGLLSKPGDVEGPARNIETLANDERVYREVVTS
jgi:glycosyltransferase involved in cell wall biosynthesis